MVHRSQLGLLHVVLNGQQIPGLLLRLMIVSSSGSNVGNVLGIAGGDVDCDSTPPLRLRPHEADHGDFRLGMIKRGSGVR